MRPPTTDKEDVMRKALILSAVLVVLTLAAAAPPQAEAGCIRCLGAFAWTPGQWGMASTCAAAETAALINAYNWAESACGWDGVCAWGSEEIVTACMWDGTQWKADGRVQFKCAVNMCQ